MSSLVVNVQEMLDGVFSTTYITSILFSVMVDQMGRQIVQLHEPSTTDVADEWFAGSLVDPYVVVQLIRNGRVAKMDADVLGQVVLDTETSGTELAWIELLLGLVPFHVDIQVPFTHEAHFTDGARVDGRVLHLGYAVDPLVAVIPS